jgi:prefoldin alpha subunit
MVKKADEQKKDDEELQRRYVHLQILKQQLNAMVEEKNALNEKAAELTTTVDALNKLEDVKKGEEIWSSLGSGAFVRSDIKDVSDVLVAVGAGVVVKETRERGITIIKGRFEELQKLDQELVAEINKFAEQVQRLESQLKHAVENR